MIDVTKINIQTVAEDSTYGEFVMDLLPRGYGYTLGTPIRRTLLTSMSGSAITSVKINGVKHEFSTITGVKEDVLKILLNLKKIIVKNHTDKPQVITLSVKGQKTVTAGDIDKNALVDVINKDLVIAEMTAKSAAIEIEMTVENGVGYVIADNLRRSKIGTIPLDANFSPVERVSMDVFPTRSGQETDLDKLVLKIWTRGNEKPSDVLKNAIDHLKSIFSGMSGVGSVEAEEEVSEKEVKTSKATKTVKKKTTKKTK
ncbi:MAG: DNA-directed RNA polymerase subunit alpha [bacterium]